MTVPVILKETANGYRSICLEDRLFEERKIFLTGPVTDASSDALLKQLMVLHDMDPYKEITLYINSPGGDVRSGMAVYDYMALIDTPIRTVCTGSAASMGAILFLGGDKRQMLPSTSLMIHDPSYGGGNFAGLKPGDIEEKLENLKKVQDMLCTIIAQKCNKSLDEVKNKTRRDSEFNADEALDYGLCTSIITRESNERSIF